MPATTVGALVQYLLRAAMALAEMGTDKDDAIEQRARKRRECLFRIMVQRA